MLLPPWRSGGCRALRRRAWVRSCSTAPARKVSQAAISTLKPFSISQKEICGGQRLSLGSPCPASAPGGGSGPYLGQVGGLADAVDAAEGDHVGAAVPLRLQHIAQDVHAALRLQDLHQGLLQGLLHRRGHGWGGAEGRAAGTGGAHGQRRRQAEGQEGTHW